MTVIQLLRKAVTPSSRPSSRRRVRPRLEELEPRVVPYALTGYSWPHPELITISFVPDGTNLGGVSSNLFAKLDAHFGSAATWQNQFLKAAQTWAQQTNINFAVVPDDGAPSGSGSYEQGDPGMGDIRIGGCAFSNSTLAVADYSPQGNNYSVGGDITFNTKVSWNIGSAYDLYTVALHEFGHALGLGESNVVGSAMYPDYSGTMKGLSSDDITGIRKIYSGGNPRSPDAYDAAGTGRSFSTAADLTSQIDTTSQTAVVTNLDVTTAGDVDYYKFTVPAGSASTFTATVQSQGRSLLAPVLDVFNSGQTLIGSASGAGQYGTSISVTVSGVQPGNVYYFKVGGADTSTFGTGQYAVVLNTGGSAAPTVPQLNTTTPNGNPLHNSGAGAEHTPVGLIPGLLDWLGGLLGGLLSGIFAGWGDAQQAPGSAGDSVAPVHPANTGAGQLTREALPSVNGNPLASPLVVSQLPGPAPEGAFGLLASPAQAALVPTPALALPAVWVDAGSQDQSGTADRPDDDPTADSPRGEEAPDGSLDISGPSTTPAASNPAPSAEVPSQDADGSTDLVPTPTTRAVVPPPVEATCLAAPDWVCPCEPSRAAVADDALAVAASPGQAIEACFAEMADLLAF